MTHCTHMWVYLPEYDNLFAHAEILIFTTEQTNKEARS